MFVLTRRRKIITLILVDNLLLIAANNAVVNFMEPFVAIPVDLILVSGGLPIVLYPLYGNFFKVSTRINRYTNLREMVAIFGSLSASAASSIIVLLFINRQYSLRLVILAYLLSLLLIIGSRLIWRIYIETRNMGYLSTDSAKNTLIVEAGEGGRTLYNSFLGSKTAQDIHAAGFVDDDPNKRNTYLLGKKVLGSLKDILELIEKYDIQMVTIATPSLSKKKLRRIFELVEFVHAKVNTTPSMEELASGKISVSKLKTIDVVDLPGRDEVELDIESIKDQITNRVILVTGARGSIGSEICRQIIQFDPTKLLLLGRGENSIYLIDRELRTHHQKCPTEIVPIITDIQDRKEVNKIMEQYHPDTVYHAAAHKHVPLMEYNPEEVVKDNIFGTKNVAEAAKAAKVKNSVMVSTDKANNPPNVMGSTKRIAEMIVTGLNEEGCTKFSAVGFGSVLGSRDSMTPVFREQIAQRGSVTVTNFRMTRYFMTIPEASRLVIQSGALVEGGEIFTLDMSEPVKIVDLAKNMVRLSGYSGDEIEIIGIGIRPGEKLYEELLLDKERDDETVYEKIFVGNIKGYPMQTMMEFVNSLP